MGGRLEIDTPAENGKVTIVLVDPKYDGNIGAVARTILNFGINDFGKSAPYNEIYDYFELNPKKIIKKIKKKL